MSSVPAAPATTDAPAAPRSHVRVVPHFVLVIFLVFFIVVLRRDVFHSPCSSLLFCEHVFQLVFVVRRRGEREDRACPKCDGHYHDEPLSWNAQLWFGWHSANRIRCFCSLLFLMG